MGSNINCSEHEWIDGDKILNSCNNIITLGTVYTTSVAILAAETNI